MLAVGGEHLDALLASFKREQLLRQRDPPPPEPPSSRSAVAERRPPLCALAEPQLLADEAATVLPRQQQHLLKQELASAQQELAVAEAAETQARRWQHEEQRQRQHGRVEAWREARDAERALGAASLESEQARQRHEQQRQQEQRHIRAARTLQRAQQQLLQQDTAEQCRAASVRPVAPARAASGPAREAQRAAEARRRSDELGAATAAAERRLRVPQYTCRAATGPGGQEERRRRTAALVRQRQARLRAREEESAAEGACRTAREEREAHDAARAQQRRQQSDARSLETRRGALAGWKAQREQQAREVAEVVAQVEARAQLARAGAARAHLAQRRDAARAGAARAAARAAASAVAAAQGGRPTRRLQAWVPSLLLGGDEGDEGDGGEEGDESDGDGVGNEGGAGGAGGAVEGADEGSDGDGDGDGDGDDRDGGSGCGSSSEGEGEGGSDKAPRRAVPAVPPAAPARFLRAGEAVRHIALVSYPRSGNSLLRSLLEASTGVLSGSDARPEATLSRQLQQAGLRGEGVCDHRVWLVKSHWPERRGASAFAAHAAILIVRSPFDCIDSYFNMVLTSSHNASVPDGEYARLQPGWAAHVRREAAVWSAFHQHWLRAKVPLLAVRYEDLTASPSHRDATLRILAEFLVARAQEEGVTDAHTTAALHGLLARVRRAAARCERGGWDGGVYRPRCGRAGDSLRHFSAEDRAAVLQSCAAEMCLFRYQTEEEAPAGPGLGLPLESAHAQPLYLPVATHAAAAPHQLNIGTCLRPKEDARGWKVAQLRGAAGRGADGVP